MQNFEKYKLKGNESFNIREGWLSKGLRAANENGEITVFTSEDPVCELGIGSNMVKSLRYWMLATGLAYENKSGRRIQKLTPFGELVRQNDVFIERANTLWLLHYHIATDSKLATVWYLFFNRLESKVFSREDLVSELSYIFKNVYQVEPTLKSFRDDCNSLIKFYYHEDEMVDPEDNLVCPFAEMGLITNKGKRLYGKNAPAHEKVDTNIVFFGILKALEINAYSQNRKLKESKLSINIDELIALDGSPAKILNLTRNRFNEYLEELKRDGLIDINRTAGLNMIYIDEHKCDLVKALRKCFEDR